MTDHALRPTCKGKVCQYSCPYSDEYKYTYIYYVCIDTPTNTVTNTNTDIDHLLNAQANTSNIKPNTNMLNKDTNMD